MLKSLKNFAQHHPIISFVVITFTYTWLVWFASMMLPNDWALRKIVTGMGFGPAIAAILISHLYGKKSVTLSSKWWRWFGFSFLLLSISYLSMLITGDAINAEEYVDSVPPGFTALNLTLSFLSATVGASIVATTFADKPPLLKGCVSWSRTPFYLLLATLLPSFWLIAGLGIAAIGDREISSVIAGLDTITWVSYALRSVLFTLLIVAIGEELGWRGWLLPALQQRMSPLLASVSLGVIWGLWHFPLYLNGAYNEPPEMVFAKVGVCIFLSVMFTWFYNRTNGNLLAAILLHTALNNSARFIPLTEEMGIFMLLTIVAMPFLDKMWRRKNVYIQHTTEAAEQA